MWLKHWLVAFFATEQKIALSMKEALWCNCGVSPQTETEASSGTVARGREATWNDKKCL
jgi:hypothetical protein